jgi:RNA polymerase sigma-70 factor (ECF subfamily)
MRGRTLKSRSFDFARQCAATHSGVIQGFGQQRKRPMTQSGQTIEQVILDDPDTDLMLRVRDDEPEAFEQLVKRCRPRLVGFLNRLVDCRDDAEDVAQEVFLRVYRARQRYQPRSRFSTWLFTIAKNLARSANRTRRGQLLVDLANDDGDPSGASPLEDLIPAAVDPPARSVDREELASFVHRAIGELKWRQRLVVELKHFEGKRYDAIARLMGLTPQAVKSLLWRARANLREILQADVSRSNV